MERDAMDILGQDTAIYSHQVDRFEILMGLSDQCRPVIENSVQEIINLIVERYSRAIVVHGWKGLVKERIVKHVAKRAMKSKLFDVLIWVTQIQKENSGLKEFQMQIAVRLGIAFSRENEDDENGALDEILASKIHECLEKVQFLLVHQSTWDLEDLSRIGIPNIRSGYYCMVLVTSTTGRLYHESVSIDQNLPEKDMGDILWEESCDISDAVSIRNVLFTPEAVTDCILYFLLFEFIGKLEIQIQSLLRYWLAEGFIAGSYSDLDAAFKSGMTLLEELRDRCIVNLNDTLCFYSFSSVMSSLRVKVQSGTLFPRTFILLLNSFKKPWKWENIDRISFGRVGEFPPCSPNCPKLLTIVSHWKYYDPIEFPENFFEHMESVRVFSVMNSHLSSLPSSIVFLGKSLKFLKLGDCKNLKYLQVSVLKVLENLEVLDLSNTPIQVMPNNSFEGLKSLRILDLSKCSKISALPSSTSFLVNLEVLLLGGCHNLCVLPLSIPLQKLQVLDLHATKLVEIPEKFFAHMGKLKDLNLSFLSRLTSLPKSMSNLVSLKNLNLNWCRGLVSVISELQCLSSSLEQLSLSGCSSVQDGGRYSSLFKDVPNLRVLNLKATNVNMLLLKGCSNLETINLQLCKNLEVLDLSGTRIEKFPLEDVPYIASLKNLELVAVKSLRSVNWKTITWLPQDVNWDQSGDGSISQMHVPVAEWSSSGYSKILISVENDNIFQSLKPSSSIWKKSCSRFLIYVHHSLKHGKGKILPPLASRYTDIYSRLKPHAPLYDRCLEIENTKMFPTGISGVLSHTDYLYLHDEWNVVKLSKLGIENMDDLRECSLKRCHAMEVLFDIGTDDSAKHQPILRCLEKLEISRMMKLTTVCASRGMLEIGSFGHLKQLQLEYCPKVAHIFSAGVCLENLEVLKIKFCARLEEIFSSEVNGVESLQRLHTLFLWELPRLKSIVRSAKLINLKKAEVRGCPLLRKFPISTRTINPNNDASVVIRGESGWWEQLDWEDTNVKHQSCFRSWKPFKIPRHA